MRYEYFIGLRYLRAKRKQAMISIVTGISIFAVALGVAALIIVLAVMTGFEEDLREKILGMNAHIVIVPSDSDDVMEDYQAILEAVKKTNGIKNAEVFVYNKVMISHSKRSDGIILKGIDPMVEGASDLKKYVINGSLEDMESSVPEAEPEKPPAPKDGIILGIELAASIGAKVNDVISVTSSSSNITPIGLLPKSKAFKVVGYFHSGMYEYDRTMAYISLKASQNLLGLKNGVNGIEVKVDDIFKTTSIAKSLRGKLGMRFWIRDWKEMNGAFFSALKLEKIAMFIILIIIFSVAAFNSVSSLTMMVMEKHKDIGILKAMGASNTSISLIFLTGGVIIGLVGTAIGFVIGTSLSWIADYFHLIRLQGEVYYINYLPFRIRITDIAAICSASLLISFLSTIYPAWQAAKLDPVEAIRYE
jgi:lipoprotein-releasing system permease protein